MAFDEHSEKGQHLTMKIEEFLIDLELDFIISFKEPRHDVARRFLNEIVEFEPAGE